jgi:hypothetical protein
MSFRDSGTYVQKEEVELQTGARSAPMNASGGPGPEEFGHRGIDVSEEVQGTNCL